MLSSEKTVNNKPTTVLIIDDDIKICSFLRVSLKLAGYDVLTATDGEEGLTLAEINKPDIMLLDILMTPMDGFDVLKKLRATSKIPVIAISAHASAAEKALNLGANAFMGKPFLPADVIRKIQIILK